MNVFALAKRFNELTLESEGHWDYKGNSNSKRDYVHGYFAYPAMMVPRMQREMLDVCLEQMQDVKPCLLDPFAGSGTILVEGMLRGLDVVGIDINPLAILLCKVKTTILDGKRLSLKAKGLLESIYSKKDVEKYDFDGINKWFADYIIVDLSKIRASIVEEEDILYRRFFWATFCEVVRIVSNSRNCTYKLHIKEKKDIDTFNVNTVKIFKDILFENIKRHNEFYTELKQRGYLKKDALTYKGKIKIILGNAIDYLNHSKKKYNLIFTSPPYGDNHTTVSYGQYSIMPLRWMNCNDIDDAVDFTLLETLCGIDRQSLGGISSNTSMTALRKQVVEMSTTLKQQLDEINRISPQQCNKIIAFYDDYNKFLTAISKKMMPNAISVWTLGNRKVAKQEIFMDKIMVELCEYYELELLTSFNRRIFNKRMPHINSFRGEAKGIQHTMTREHILIFARSDSKDD